MLQELDSQLGMFPSYHTFFVVEDTLVKVADCRHRKGVKSLAFGVDVLGLLGILLEKGLVAVYNIPLADSTLPPLQSLIKHLLSLGLSALYLQSSAASAGHD